MAEFLCQITRVFLMLERLGYEFNSEGRVPVSSVLENGGVQGECDTGCPRLSVSRGKRVPDGNLRFPVPVRFLSQPCFISGEKKTNKHKQLRGIVPEMGGGQIVYVFPLFLGKKGNT